MNSEELDDAINVLIGAVSNYNFGIGIQSERSRSKQVTDASASVRTQAAVLVAAEWAKAVWVARDLARQGATAQAVLDALLNERARIDGLAQ